MDMLGNGGAFKPSPVAIICLLSPIHSSSSLGLSGETIIVKVKRRTDICWNLGWLGCIVADGYSWA